MRKLNTGDVFKMARLLKNTNMVESVKTAFEKGKEDGADEMKVGIDFVCDVLCACSEERTETQLYDLLSGICEKKPDEIRSQSLETTVQDIQRIFEENNVLNFFRSASRLSGKIHG